MTTDPTGGEPTMLTIQSTVPPAFRRRTTSPASTAGASASWMCALLTCVGCGWSSTASGIGRSPRLGRVQSRTPYQLACASQAALMGRRRDFRAKVPTVEERTERLIGFHAVSPQDVDPIGVYKSRMDINVAPMRDHGDIFLGV